MLKAIANFLLGKDPEIFNKKGRVEHDLGDKKWTSWDQRFDDEDYNWRRHTGRKDKTRKTSDS